MGIGTGADEVIEDFGFKRIWLTDDVPLDGLENLKKQTRPKIYFSIYKFNLKFLKYKSHCTKTFENRKSGKSKTSRKKSTD